MNKFETELLNGNFVISNCINCKQVVWPPSNYCNICHNETKWSNSKQVGKIIEFSKKNDQYFCLIEIEQNLRVLGEVLGETTPKINQKVQLKKCSYRKTPQFLFELLPN